jgi:cell division protein FtsB
MTDEFDDQPTTPVEAAQYGGLELAPDPASAAVPPPPDAELGAPDVETGAEAEKVVVLGAPDVEQETHVEAEAPVVAEADDESPGPAAARENPLLVDVSSMSEAETPLDQVVPEKHAMPRRLHMERPAQIAVASLALIAILFLFVFPTRAYLAQQRQVSDARKAVAVLQAENAELAREAGRLQTKGEIERMARVQFNMVFKGEQAYNVISPRKSSTTTTLP